MFGIDNVEKVTNILCDFLAYVDSFYNEKWYLSYQGFDQ